MTDLSPLEGKPRSTGALETIFVLLGLAVLVAASACKNSPSPKSTGKDSRPEIKTVLHLEPFVVNLADPEDNHFLRVGVDLGLDVALAGKGGEGAVPTARIRDCILEVLSSWHSDALLAPEGKEKLKTELLQALRARAPEVGIKEIYFTDFLVQR